MPIAGLGLPEGLPALIKRKYVAAEAAKNLSFSKTQLTILHVDGIPVRNEFMDLRIMSHFILVSVKILPCVI